MSHSRFGHLDASCFGDRYHHTDFQIFKRANEWPVGSLRESILERYNNTEQGIAPRSSDCALSSINVDNVRLGDTVVYDRL
jgi:hypothetical protein